MANYTSHKYEFDINILGETLTDISSLSCIRCPILNVASYSILNMSLRSLFFLVLQTEIEKGNFPKIELICYLLDPLQEGQNVNVGKRIETVFKKQFKVLKCTTHEYPTNKGNKLNCTLVLVNPILLYLNNTNSYNKILLGKTGLDIIKDYEAHLKSMFGDIIEFKKVGENVEKNSHSYEQLMIRLANDLIIPSWIIQTYKPFHTPSFYFFDDFRIDKKSKKDITAYLINLGDKDKFPKQSTLDAKDIFMANKFQRNYQIGDPFHETENENPSMIIKDFDMSFKFRKAQGNTKVPKLNSQQNAFNIEDRSVSAVQTSQQTDGSFKPTEEEVLYVPDNMDNAKKRLKNANKLLKTDISAISAYTLKDSHMDFIQFGATYVLNPHEHKEYRHTPIGIVNHFVRESGQFPFVIHNCTYQTITFKTNEDWM